MNGGSGNNTPTNRPKDPLSALLEAVGADPDSHDALSSHSQLPLDERFLRGRGCALPLAPGNGEAGVGFGFGGGPQGARAGRRALGALAEQQQGLLELEAAWVEPAATKHQP